jgi:hypothetical protein
MMAAAAPKSRRSNRPAITNPFMIKELNDQG